MDTQAGNPGKSRSKLSDDDFLAIVQSERRQSIGFEHDNILLSEREQALNYLKGQMDDMPNLPNRSSAVSTDIAEAVETLLPDLMEIFTGGDDVATFKPVSEKDEAAAKQETEYVNQVVFQENDGFLALYSMFKDALINKIGVVKMWWQAKPIKPEFFSGKTDLEVVLMAQDGEIKDITVDGQDAETGEPTHSFTLTREDPGGECKVMAVPSEDFTVSADTVNLADATYCAFRTRPRKQDLIEQGLDAAIVDDLPPYGQTSDEAVQLARDQAGEHYERFNLVGDHGLGQVEIIEHFVKVDADEDGYPEIWRILTGGNETVLIEKERVDRIPFAAVTPYIIPYRFYGESVSNKLAPIQRIKTALLRMMLDSGYFALNQRHEVADQGANQWTISDLLRNEPGLPIRVKQAGTVVPVQSGALSFDTFQALEYVSVMGEQRTGVVRNAQGLNPDSLHDTSGGMQAQMQSAQMRMRLIARNFAETGVKDLFLGVHALLRKHKHQATAKIGGQWAPVDCSQWGERSAMTISVGLGSAGRMQELAAMSQILSIQKEIVQLQGGASGPVVTLPNIYKAVIRLGEKAGELAVDQFFTDPTQGPPPPPQPQPGAAEAQADMQAKQMDIQARQQTEAAKLAQQDKEHQARIAFDFAAEHDKDERERLKIQMEHDREVMKLQTEAQIKQAELAVRREDVVNRLQLEEAKLANALQIAQISAGVQVNTVQVKAQAEADRAAVDLELQARDHNHQDDLGDYVAANQPAEAAKDGDQ